MSAGARAYIIPILLWIMKWFSDHFLKISGACTEFQSVFVKAVAGINAFRRLHFWFDIKSEFGCDDIGVDGR